MTEPEKGWWQGSDAPEARDDDELPLWQQAEHSDHSQYSNYSPVREHRPIRDLLSRIWAPVAAAIGIAAKFGFLLKFFSVFIAFGGYALIWGWKFAIGVVALLFFHEMGHFVEAKREGLNPRWPVFIPFLGAYVRYTSGHPWQTVRVAVAGPILGGAAAAVCYGIAESNGSRLFYALAYFGFVLNLFNLLPIGPFDGGAIWRSARWLYHENHRAHAVAAWLLFGATALALVLGAIAAYVPQDRI